MWSGSTLSAMLFAAFGGLLSMVNHLCMNFRGIAAYFRASENLGRL